MIKIDDPEAKETAGFFLVVSVGLVIFSSAEVWIPWIGDISPLGRVLSVPRDTAEFAFQCAAILFILATCQWVYRQKLIVTEDGVNHLPAYSHKHRNYRWSDVDAWGSRVVFEYDESGKQYPTEQFYVQLRNGMIIEEPGFSTSVLSVALEDHVGKRINICVDSANTD